MNVFQRISNSLKAKTKNLFNEAFYKVIGNVGSDYDPKNSTYLKEGYQENSFVYSIIQAQAKKN